MATMPYRALIGSLLHLARRTRPDICYAVSVLCRFTIDLSWNHWAAATRVVRYFAGTKDYGLSLGTQSGTSKESLFAYSDSDWAGGKDDWKSTSGCSVFLNGESIAWSSEKQKCIEPSSAEAEYVALPECVKVVSLQ